jgi:rhomboid-like protein
MVKVRMYDRVVANLSKLPGSGAPPFIRGSLGASGAIYACVTLTAMAYPDLKISLLFLPWGVPIRLGVGAMMTLDLVGIIRGWRCGVLLFESRLRLTRDGACQVL